MKIRGVTVGTTYDPKKIVADMNVMFSKTESGAIVGDKDIAAIVNALKSGKVVVAHYDEKVYIPTEYELASVVFERTCGAVIERISYHITTMDMGGAIADLKQFKVLPAPEKAQVGQTFRVAGVDFNGNVTAVETVDGIGGSAGGAKAFYITVTADGDSYSADKTVEEIEAAYQAGSPLYCYCTSPVDGITYCLPLGARLYDGTVYCFGNASVQGVMTVVIRVNGVDVEADTIPTKKDLENVGKPTDEQVITAVNSYLADHPVSGLSSAEKSLFLTLFKNTAYTANMSGTIARLEALWSGGDAPDIPDEPIGGNIVATDDGNGNVTVSGATATDDGAGNVTVIGATATDDDNGNVTVS